MDDQHIGQAPQVQLLVRLHRRGAGNVLIVMRLAATTEPNQTEPGEGSTSPAASGPPAKERGRQMLPVHEAPTKKTHSAPQYLHVRLALGAVPAVVGIQLLGLQERLQSKRQGVTRAEVQWVRSWRQVRSRHHRLR